MNVDIDRLSPTHIVGVDPCDDGRWAALMASEAGSLFGSPPWIRAIVATYDFEVRARILVGPDGAATAGFAYALLDDPRGRRAVSLPFCDRLDPVCGDESAWLALAGTMPDEVPTTVRVLRNPHPHGDPRFQEKGELAWHETMLGRPEEALVQAFDPVVRRNLRVAARHGVTVEASSSREAVHSFYALHEQTRKRKYRLLPQPLAFFDQIHEQFGDDCVAVLATHEGTVIAGTLVVVWNNVAYYKFSASIAERLVVRPNEAVALGAMRYAMERGCRSFDWGVSDLDQPGLVAYKRKFATTEERVTVLRSAVPGPGNPSADRFGATLGELTELLTRDSVPDDVTREAGAQLYRYFA